EAPAFYKWNRPIHRVIHKSWGESEVASINEAQRPKNWENPKVETLFLVGLLRDFWMGDFGAERIFTVASLKRSKRRFGGRQRKTITLSEREFYNDSCGAIVHPQLSSDGDEISSGL